MGFISGPGGFAQVGVGTVVTPGHQGLMNNASYKAIYEESQARLNSDNWISVLNSGATMTRDSNTMANSATSLENRILEEFMTDTEATLIGRNTGQSAQAVKDSFTKIVSQNYGQKAINSYEGFIRDNPAAIAADPIAMDGYMNNGMSGSKINLNGSLNAQGDTHTRTNITRAIQSVMGYEGWNERQAYANAMDEGAFTKTQMEAIQRRVGNGLIGSYNYQTGEYQSAYGGKYASKVRFNDVTPGYISQLDKFLEEEAAKETVSGQDIFSGDEDRSGVVISNLPEEEPQTAEQEQNVTEQAGQEEAIVTDEQPKSPNAFEQSFDVPGFKPITDQRVFGQEARILSSYIGKEAMDLGFDSPKSLLDVKYGEVSPLQERADLLSKQMKGEVTTDVTGNARSLLAQRARQGILGAESAGGGADVSGAQGSFAREADRASGEMARKQVISDMKQQDEARKSLIGMKAEILGEDIKRRQEKAKLRGKVAVGLAGQKETAKQIAQANFMAGLTRFED